MTDRNPPSPEQQTTFRAARMPAACLDGETAGRLSASSHRRAVNTIAPGFIASEMLAHVQDKVLRRPQDKIPVGRLGRPDEIPRVVHFLVADQSSFITGAIWAVNGGMDM